MSCALILTLSPKRKTDPSTTASTFNSRAMSGTDRSVPLNCITDVREITVSAPIWASSVISRSCMPSTKYSCSASPERLTKGSTANLSIGPPPPPDPNAPHPPAITTAAAATTAPTIALALRRRGCNAASVVPACHVPLSSSLPARPTASTNSAAVA